MMAIITNSRAPEEPSSTNNPNVRLTSEMRCRVCHNAAMMGNALIFCKRHGYWLRVRIIEGLNELDQVWYLIPQEYMFQQAEAWFAQNGPSLDELPGSFEPSDDLLEGLEGFME
ncbi:hypothetical protein K435DRAFT_799964 [Dendrothele bispora CBS 962.96]|uniref:Uncharacterized protein n=1 Tax=Dendrothele bispora (strain CBS 962.96) TaxID=1314807 RepID=A0A4S8LU70_DENBC|nr:hypothetical protein K435DRAFT_799964 [Dendrothele bispora CBS 962.96]